MNIIGHTILNQYRIDASIASGGMGTVYRVWDLKRNVPLSMKILHKGLTDDPLALRRFQREANALKKLTHPNIVPFYGLYQTSDFVFLLERFIDGPTLKDILEKKRGPTSLDEALTYIAAMSAALGYAHHNGLVHCDVKPGNVMIDQGGNIFLTDFGISRSLTEITATFAGAGTPAYMAPEQIRGEAVSPATDVYALGIILYEMLTGKRAFRGYKFGNDINGDTFGERIRYENLNIDPPDPRELNPSIPMELAATISKAMAKSSAERYKDATEFFAAVQSATGITRNSIPTRIDTNKFHSVFNDVEQNETPIQHLPKSGTNLSPVITFLPGLIISCVVLILVLVLTQVLDFSKLTEIVARLIEFVVAPLRRNIPTILGVFALLTLFVGTAIVWRKIRPIFFRRLAGDEGNPVSPNRLTKKDINPTLITALDARKRHEIIGLVGREHELRLKDRIVFFSGQKCLLRGFGRFGGTTLITQIIERAKVDIASRNQGKVLLLSASLEFYPTINANDAIKAIIRDLQIDILRADYSWSIAQQLRNLQKKYSIKDYSTETSVSVKAAAGPFGEASFTRKQGQNGANGDSILSDGELLDIFEQILDGKTRGRDSQPFERMLGGILANKTLPARIIIIIDKIENDKVFDMLRQLKILDDERIFVFGIVKQNIYSAWGKDKKEKIEVLGFESIYVPCLWETETSLIENLITEIMPAKKIDIEDSIEDEEEEIPNELRDLRDHIAYVSRGAPGEVLKRLLSTELCNYKDGIPEIAFDTIQQWELIKYNAQCERLISKNWEKVLPKELKGLEEIDQAKIGVYEILDWIRQEVGFTFEELIAEAQNNKIPIAKSKLLKTETASTLIETLIQEKFLVEEPSKKYRLNEDFM